MPRLPSTARTCSTSVTDRARALRGWAALLGGLWFVQPHSAWAQAKDPAAPEALFREGRALSDAGDIAGACAKFRESDRLDPAVGTTFNIADCEERLGHLARAWTLFDEVAQRLPAADKRRDVAKKRAAALEPRLPKLNIRLATSAAAGARVVRDGVELGSASLGTALPVDPGEHVVVVSAAGRQDRSFKVVISEREIRALEVEPGEPVVAGSGEKHALTVASDAGPAKPSRSATLGYVVGGVGVAGLIVGAVAGMLVLKKKGVVDEHCDASKQCDEAGLEATSSGKTWGVITTLGLVTGAVGVGAGTYLVLSAGSSDDRAAGSLAVSGRF